MGTRGLAATWSAIPGFACKTAPLAFTPLFTGSPSIVFCISGLSTTIVWYSTFTVSTTTDFDTTSTGKNRNF